MSAFATAVLLIYSVLMLLGGVIGYRAAGSRASLLAGLMSGLALLGAFAWSRSNPTGGFIAGAVIALALTVVFALRFAKTGSFMPSGMLLLTSILALIILAIAGFSSSGRPG